MNKIFGLFIFVIIFLCPPLYAQDNVDSLMVAFQKMEDDSNKINALLKQASIYNSEGHYKNALILSGKAEKIALKLNNNMLLGKVYNSMGISSDYLRETDAALSYYDKAITCYKRTKNFVRLGRVYQNKAIMYVSGGNIPEGLETILTGLRYSEKVNDTIGILSANVNMGSVYFSQKDYKNARPWFLRCLAMKPTDKTIHHIANANYNLGAIYLKLMKLDSSSFFYRNALMHYENMNDRLSMADVQRSLGAIERSRGNYKLAEQYYLSALTVLRKADNVISPEIFLNLGILYRFLKQYDKSLKYIDTAYISHKKNQFTEGLTLCIEHHAMTYAAMGKYKEAYETHLRFQRMNDSIFNESRLRELSDIKTQYEVSKREEEIKIQQRIDKAKQDAKTEEERLQNKIIIGSILVVLVLIVIFSILLLNRIRISKKQNKIIAEQKQQVEAQKELLEIKQKEIIDSINYARRIQYSIMPTELNIKKALKRLNQKK